VLAAHRGAAETAGINWKAAVYQQIESERKETELSLRQMCDLAWVSRASFYRFPTAGRREEAMGLRDAMQRIALEFPSYGWPRVTKELQRRGWAVNHKRVYRLMREDNLLCLRKRKFVVTTDSNHPFPVYPNLAAGVKLTNVNQLWVADITYIRLLLEFVYLAVILDAFSRRGVGWALGRSLETELTLRALRMALERRRPAAGLVHHSDRGVQYAAKDYIDVLKKHSIEISMSRRGNPFDNAICESFMKTLKYEQVYREDYRVFEEAEAGIEYFIDDVYNEKRLHSALGFLPPAEFEASLGLRTAAGAVA
jgi:transposase InsO family protein